MSNTQDQYLQVFCGQFALLMQTDAILEIVEIDKNTRNTIQWRGDDLKLFDLTQILLGESSTQGNKNALIVEVADNKYSAIGVSRVAAIKLINDNEFQQIPSLKFDYNLYFNQAYIDPSDKQCIYRLNISAFS